MNYKMMSRFEAWILAIEAVFMLPAFFISLFSGADKATLAFAMSIGILAVVAGLFALASIGAREGFYAREGLICVCAGWILMSLFGCLPFWLSGEIPRFIDALFEIVSGFTTTGASILSDVESLSNGILYWRSFSHWLGGMGVLVFLLAIVPSGGRKEGFTMHLLRAESPGPDVGKLAPKMRRTATVLYLTYIGLTVLNIVFLLIGDMPLFEAVCTALGTAGTGGFGVKNDSLASYSAYSQYVVAVFMLLFGTNLNIFFLIITGHFIRAVKSEELRWYFCIVTAAVAGIFISVGLQTAFTESAFRHSFFQVASIISTTGFYSADFELWPVITHVIILILMFCGGCAGSTAGGIKISRIMLLLKNGKREVRYIAHPRAMISVKLEGKTVDHDTIRGTTSYIIVFIALLVSSVLAVIAIEGCDLITGFTSVSTCLNNVGPGLGEVGPTDSFGTLSDPTKLILCFDMLAGRLELFPMLMLFSPSAWKHHS